MTTGNIPTPPEPNFSEDDFPPIPEVQLPVQDVNVSKANPLPEAGGIAFATLYTQKGAAINVTARAHGPKEAIKELVDAIVWAMAEYSMTADRPGAVSAPAKTPDPAAKIAADAGNKPLAAAIQAQGEAVSPAPGGKPWLTMEISRIVIKAEPGDVYTLECFAPGHKWPDLKVSKRKADVIAGMLKHITSADPTKPADYQVNAIAYYLEGKPKENGGFWLDLYHLRLA